jgi:hypothetical protein
VVLFTFMQIPLQVYFYFPLPFLNYLSLSTIFLSLDLGFTALVWLLMVDSGLRQDYVWTDWKAQKE